CASTSSSRTSTDCFLRGCDAGTGDWRRISRIGRIPLAPIEREGPHVPDSSETQQLRDEIKRLLADALRGEASHAAELRRRDGVHEAEADERELTFIEQLDRQARLHADEIALLLS